MITFFIYSKQIIFVYYATLSEIFVNYSQAMFANIFLLPQRYDREKLLILQHEYFIFNGCQKWASGILYISKSHSSLITNIWLSYIRLIFLITYIHTDAMLQRSQTYKIRVNIARIVTHIQGLRNLRKSWAGTPKCKHIFMSSNV